MNQATPEWLQMRERGNSAVLGWMRWMAVTAPRWITNPLVWMISLYFTLFPGHLAGSASRDYLQRVLGRRPRFAECHRHVRSFAHVIFERVRLLEGDFGQFKIASVNESIVKQRAGEGRGGVLLSAHFGSFEALRAFDRELPELTVRYLMFQGNAQASSRILDTLNRDVAAQIISLDDGPGAMLQVRDALDRGEFVAFLGDRTPSQNPRSALIVRFFEQPVRLPRSPYIVAMLAGVPLIVCFAARVGEKSYEIEFTEIYDGANVARGDRDAKCTELAQRFADELAEMCRKHPYNWFNFFNIWG